VAASDPERVQQAGQPAPVREPLPARPGPEGLQETGRRDRLAVSGPNGGFILGAEGCVADYCIARRLTIMAAKTY
jgi:hypothetical protein